MNTWLYDSTFRGFITVIHILMTENWPEVIISKDDMTQPGLFSDGQTIVTADQEKYDLMLKTIETRISREAVNIIKSAFLSESRGIEQMLYTFIRMGLETGPAIIHMIEDDHIHRVLKESRRTFFEANKYKGIIRFTDKGDGIKYACMEPDTNVLPLVAAHFRARFPGERWILHDTKRHLILLHEAGNLELIEETSENVSSAAAPGNPGTITANDPYADLWKKYFGTMGIEGRKNSKLQRQFLPLKRRKYVLELDN